MTVTWHIQNISLGVKNYLGAFVSIPSQKNFVSIHRYVSYNAFLSWECSICLLPLEGIYDTSSSENVYSDLYYWSISLWRRMGSTFQGRHVHNSDDILYRQIQWCIYYVQQIDRILQSGKVGLDGRGSRHRMGLDPHRLGRRHIVHSSWT